MYLLFITFIFFLTASLPWWLPKFIKRHPPQAAPNWLPVLAGLLFCIAGWLPDIHISHQTTTFQEHFVGGGLYCALLFVYLKRAFGWKRSRVASFVALYAFTCALGVANELFEFVVTQLNITHIDITDTSWDLAANTLGAVVGYVLLVLFKQDS